MRLTLVNEKTTFSTFQMVEDHSLKARALYDYQAGEIRQLQDNESVTIDKNGVHQISQNDLNFYFQGMTPKSALTPTTSSLGLRRWTRAGGEDMLLTDIMGCSPLTTWSFSSKRLANVVLMPLVSQSAFNELQHSFWQHLRI